MRRRKCTNIFLFFSMLSNYWYQSIFIFSKFFLFDSIPLFHRNTLGTSDNTSQRRYVHYFSSVLTGTRPSSAPMRMVRIIINTIPNYSNNPKCQGCCPYIQIFQSGKLIATAASYAYDKGNLPLKIGDKLGLNFVNISDGSISFLLDCHVQVTYNSTVEIICFDFFLFIQYTLNIFSLEDLNSHLFYIRLFFF